MTRDYEDIYDLDSLGDDELKQLVREALADNATLDADNILVTAEDGLVRLEGRVGTEEELRIAERVLADTLGLTRYENGLVVDPIRRDTEPEAVDDHLAHLDDQRASLLGDRPDDEMGPEAEHLVEDLDARLYGTTDVQSAIERGTAWLPPIGPTPEGLDGTDAEPGTMSEDH